MSQGNNHLYRGANLEMHRINAGRVRSKERGPFEHTFPFDGSWRFDGSATFGPSAQNAVLYHQQSGHDTAGVSTTPHVARARYYATRTRDNETWRLVPGVIYVIDRTRLPGLDVREHVVAATVQPLSLVCPDDDEVILVPPGDGELPPASIVEVLEVRPAMKGL